VINFNIAGTVVDDLATELRGLSDIDIVQVDGRWLLVVASQADSAITTFELASDGTPTLVDSQSYSIHSGTRTVWRLNYAFSSGDFLILPATRYEDQTALFKLHSSGILSPPRDGGITGDGLGISETVVIGGSNYIFAQSYSTQRLMVYRLSSSQHLAEVQILHDSDAVFLGDISALEHIQIGTAHFLVVTSAFDAGLSSYQINTNGHLSLVDTVPPDAGAGFAKPQALAALETGGQNFVVMASAGSSSLTVYRIGANGNFRETDHLIDSLETRFQGASVLESFTFQNRQFLVAAGSDDGITVLELWADGTLHVESSLADTYDTTLANVSGLAVQILNGVPVLFVSSATDHGFTRIELSISTSYREIRGGRAEDELLGSPGNDKIFGNENDDILNGAAGDDWLEDGSGADILTGGAGADVFSFVQDGETDIITDFDITEDHIDLSKFTDIHSFEDLRIVSGCGGVLIYAADEFFKLEFGDHSHFDALDLTASHFDF